jgi:hypothetical protein
MGSTRRRTWPCPFPCFNCSKSFLLRTASHHLQSVNEILTRIETHKRVPAGLRTALQAVASSFSSYSYTNTLFNFIGEVESEAGKILTDDKTGQLIRAAYLVLEILHYYF